MNKADALDAAPIVQRCCKNLMLTLVPPYGRVGSKARRAIGDTIALAYPLLRADELGPYLDACFTLAPAAGATLPAIEHVRLLTSQETPKTLGGALIQNSLIQFCLITEANIVGAMTFTSRQDVDAIQLQITPPFTDAIEQAADAMDQVVYVDLVALFGSIISYLVATQRPLPRMLNFQFIEPSPTLVLAYRLYSDAGRADQVRDENKIVHPAFAPASGQALSA